MQIHATDRVELTILLDQADYRRLTRDVGRGMVWQNLVVLLLPLAALVSLAAEQYLGALLLAFYPFLLVVMALTTRRRSIGKLPDWAFAPTTYRFTPEGLDIETPLTRRFVAWPAVTEYAKTPVAYWFTIPGSLRTGLVRRTLTERDEAALEALLARHVARRKGGDPAAPQPAPAPASAPPSAGVRSAAPEA